MHWIGVMTEEWPAVRCEPLVWRAPQCQLYHATLSLFSCQTQHSADLVCHLMRT